MLIKHHIYSGWHPFKMGLLLKQSLDLYVSLRDNLLILPSIKLYVIDKIE